LRPGEYPPGPISHIKPDALVDSDGKSYVYLMVVAKDAHGLLANCADVMMGINHRGVQPRSLEIARSAFRRMGGWVCLTMCLALPDEPQILMDVGVLDHLKEQVRNRILALHSERAGLEAVDERDVLLLCEVTSGREPFTSAEQPAAGLILDTLKDSPGVLHDLVNAAYGLDYKPGMHGYWVVQYDQWSKGTGTAPRGTWQSKHVFGLFGNDQYVLTKWIDRAKAAVRSFLGGEEDGTRWLTGKGEWHSIKAPTLYHSDIRCETGRSIPWADYKHGRGIGGGLCQQCRSLTRTH
jgi:hypothetical protein